MKEFTPEYSLGWLVKTIVWAAILFAAFYFGSLVLVRVINVTSLVISGS